MIARSDVSVVINAYDEEPRLLAEAITSAVDQTVPPSEILLVDDGSARDYSAVIAAFPGLRVIRQANQGLAAARNTGLAAATGTYVVFLDGDDRLMPGALAHNLRRFTERPDAAMAYGGYRYIDADGHSSFQAMQPELASDIYASFLEGNCVGMHATVMYRRDALLELGGFQAGLPACEDYEVYLRMARRHAIAAGSEVVAEYRQHNGNMSKDASKMLRAALGVLRKQEPIVGGNPAWTTAYTRGMREWKDFYARSQLLAVQHSLTEGTPAAGAITGLLRLSLVAPFAIVKVAVLELITRLRARLRHVTFGSLRRTTPISRHFGYDRGKPVDRVYIEDFLARHAGDVRGRVLEVGDDSYTRRYGGTRVTHADVFHVDPNAPNATFSGDLAGANTLPDATFDCVVLTQTLHLLFDVDAAARTLHRILKPGGVLLLTVPGVSSVDRGEWGGTWYWSFTPASLGRLLRKHFQETGVTVTGYGNVLSATAFLYGLAEDDLRPHELLACDPQIPVIVAARAVKPNDGHVDV